MALDESYLDLSNIHSKLQRHSVFESEIISNNERFVQVTIYYKALLIVNYICFHPAVMAEWSKTLISQIQVENTVA